MSDFLTKMKSASQRFAGTVADAGAKTMLKTDMVFLERDIKTRKEAFGVEIYDILKSANNDNSATSCAEEIQKAFEQCQGDIQHLENKVTSKQDEMRAIDQSSNAAGAGGSGSGGTGAGNVLGGSMDDGDETPGIPSTP